MKLFLIIISCLSFFLLEINGHYRAKVKQALEEFGCDESYTKFLECKNVNQEWDTFSKTYKKEYANETVKLQRKEIFEAAGDKIHENQQLFANGSVPYVLGYNKFSDLSQEEFREKYLGAGNVPRGGQRTPFQGFSLRNRSFFQRKSLLSGRLFSRWRDNEVATDSLSDHSLNLKANLSSEEGLDLRVAAIAVKDQKSCGSCWAFAAVAIVEYGYYKRQNKYVALSEQKAMDCARQNGCDGGWQEEALTYYVRSGLPSSAAIPYTAVNARCASHNRPSSPASVATTRTGPTSYGFVSPNTEENLVASLQKYGWLSISVNADQWQYYAGGVFQDTGKTTTINHAVVLVGYGYDTTFNISYWLIRNSWGANWGEQGYIRIERGKNAFQIVGDSKGSTYVVTP